MYNCGWCKRRILYPYAFSSGFFFCTKKCWESFTNWKRNRRSA
jgi:hypothetical protein